MRVDTVIPIFNPSKGGTQNATLCLARELRRKCSVTVHTCNAHSEPFHWKFLPFSHNLPERDTIEGVSIRRYRFLRLPAINLFSPALIKAILSNKTEIVHIQAFAALLQNMLLLNIAKWKTFILTLHGFNEAILRIDKLPLKTLIKRILVLLYLNKFAGVIALSDADKRVLISLGCQPNKIVVIPNGIDDSMFTKTKAKQIREIGENKIIRILCVARFDLHKGYEDLVMALRLIKEQGERFKAYFVGLVTNRGYFLKIRMLIKEAGLDDCIDVATDLDKLAIGACYCNSNIFVIASRMETLPLVILEAMYAGLPIVATKVGGVPCIIKDGINGYLVNPRNPMKLADRIMKLLRSAELREIMGARNKEMSRGFTWKAVAERVFQLYNVLCQHNISNKR